MTSEREAMLPALEPELSGSTSATLLGEPDSGPSVSLQADSAKAAAIEKRVNAAQFGDRAQFRMIRQPPPAANAAEFLEHPCPFSPANPLKLAGVGASGSAGGARSARHNLRLHRQQSLALQFLARQLAGPADRFGLFASALLGGFLIVAAKLHFAENALALHLFLQRFEGLVDIVVADENLHGHSCVEGASTPD